MLRGKCIRILTIIKKGSRSKSMNSRRLLSRASIGKSFTIKMSSKAWRDKSILPWKNTRSQRKICIGFQSFKFSRIWQLTWRTSWRFLILRLGISKNKKITGWRIHLIQQVLRPTLLKILIFCLIHHRWRTCRKYLSKRSIYLTRANCIQCLKITLST